MSDIPFGKLATAFDERDAVHIAYLPIMAGEDLMPGAHVRVVSLLAYACTAEEAVGVVDPFLSRRVDNGQWFYLLIWPNTVTGMRHHWKHPLFVDQRQPTSDAVAEALDVLREADVSEDIIERIIAADLQAAADPHGDKKWLTNFAADIGISYERLKLTLIHCKDGVYGSGFIWLGHTFGVDTPSRCYSDAAEMWERAKRLWPELADATVEQDEVPFSCAC